VADNNENKTPKKTGRPSSYKPEYNQQALKLTKLGAIDKDLAEFFNVSETTINNWKNEFPEFLESLKDGKFLVDSRVERSLYERAIGYKAKDTKFATYEGEITDEKEYIKHYAPDVTACIFWLKNRRPEQWREKPEGDNENSEIADALKELARALPV